MSETVEGSRDPRGEWNPAVRPAPAPLFVWPPRPLQTWKFVTGNPGYLFPWNIMFCIVAAATWLYTQPDGDFPETEVHLRGGSLYIFSDGLTEAETESGDQLGREGFERLVSKHAGVALAERVAAIVDSVSQLELRDDLTLLAVSDEARLR